MVTFCFILNFCGNTVIVYPKTFLQLYFKEERILNSQFDELMGCMNIKPLFNCMKKDKEIYKTKYSKEYYIKHPFNLSFYNNIELNYEILIRPKKIYSFTNIVIVIPISPTQILPRIAIRQTYSKIKKYNEYRYKYIFVMGKPDLSDDNKMNGYNSYSFNYLVDENSIFDDILVFNYTNSYKLITLQLLLCYKYILENYRNIEYVVRANSDMFIKSDLLGKLISKYKSYDVIGYKVLYKETLIYPCGAFYIFSKRLISIFIDKYKYVTPMHDIEDVYYGEIMKKYNVTNIKWTNNEDVYISLWQYNFKNIYLKKSLVAIHELPSSVIIYLWKHFYEKRFHNIF